MNFFARSLSFVVLLTALTSLNAKESAEQKGLRLANENKEFNDGFVGETSDMEMILLDAHGGKTVRVLKGWTSEGKDEDGKGLIEFVRPLDVKGTKLLTWAEKNKDDKQWLYLKSLKRVKRIKGSGKGGSFMGSEFTFEDLGSQPISKFNIKFLKDEKVGGNDTWVTQRIPKDKSSNYSKQVIWTSKKHRIPVKVEYYNKRGELYKVATMKGFEPFKVGKKQIYRAAEIHMKNVQSQKQSTIKWKNRKLGKKIKKSIFNKNKLKR